MPPIQTALFPSLYRWKPCDTPSVAVITDVIGQIPLWKSTLRFRVKVSPMNMRNVNALVQTGLNEFLFADVGTEPNGTTLTLATVFARLGSDPWIEADRLATLSRPAAIESLARTIATMPGSHWNLSDANPIAARLAELLPLGAIGRVVPIARAAAVRRPPRASTIAILVLVALCAIYAAAIMTTGDRTEILSDSGSSAPTTIQ